AAAGLGALLATLVGKFEKFIPRSIFILIAVFDITLGLVHSWYLAIAVSFMLGFVFNRSRINQRTVMFDFIKTKEETVIWSSRSTLAFQFTKAALPLTLALPIQWIGIMHAGHLFGVIGTIVAATMMVIYLNELNHRKKVEVLQQEVAPKSF
ncbi:MFS transporter, partial [Bacillus sp. SS-TM]